MAGRAAVDPDILVYAVWGSGAKRGQAKSAIARSRIVPSQALNETAHVLRGKAGMALPGIVTAPDVIRDTPRVVPLAEGAHALALETARETGCSLWDASILAASIEAGRDELVDEDMQDGREVRATTIRNPSADRAR